MRFHQNFFSIPAGMIVVFVLLNIFGCTRTMTLKTGDQIPASFSAQVVIDVDINYLIYLPQDYSDNGKKFPLILFLHGMGERGKDLNLVKKHGPPMLIEKGKQFPFIIVSPQCSDDQFGWSVDVLNALLDRMIDVYNVDQERIYVTGLSMGGYGTWALAEKIPDRLAAIAPICGGGNPEKVDKLRNLPIWVFHGSDDMAVPLAESQKMVEALEKVGNNVKFTIYPGIGHDSWTETYANDQLYEWLLAQKKGA